MNDRKTNNIFNDLPESIDKCTCFNLRKAARIVTQLFDEAMQACGLRATQFTLLVALAKKGTVTVNQLSQVLVMDRTTLTRNLKPLEKQRLVKIVPGEDRRTRALNITGEGRKILENAVPMWEKAQARVIKQLTPKRWKELLKELDTTVKVLGKK